ncbi:Zinc knuckle CX2CX4HX4C [Arabidopsis thaliana x Arabidopsis arenosa]|nr:Zinc knuckle CX2CX4HX4C [Arabidopsis thaliana x Arabidopsis arenosa]
MLLIAKYSETLILKTTQYWDGLRTILNSGGRVNGRVISWSLLLFLVLDCLVECGMEKTLKLAVEVIGRVNDDGEGSYSTKGSSGVVKWGSRLLDLVVEWWIECRGRVICCRGCGQVTRSLGFVFVRILFGLGRGMSQSGLVNQGSNVSNTMKLKIKVPRFDNSSLIEGYSKTLIGRCMNPAMQDMKSLLFMLPKIWKLEDRVVGANLGQGEVQAVDLDFRRVQVKLDGFKPLCFEAAVEFHSGEETMVSLWYERLFGFCQRCYSLCHEQMRCPIFGDKGKQSIFKEDPKRDNTLQRYKGAAINGSVPGTSSGSTRAVFAEPSQGLSSIDKKDASIQDSSNRSKQIYDTVGMGFPDHEKKMLETFLAPEAGKTVTDLGTLGANMEGILSGTMPSKVVRKKFFSGPEEVTIQNKAENALGLAEQHDLFSDDLSQLLVQSSPLEGDPSLQFMDTKMEDKESSGAELTHEDGEFFVANEEDFDGDKLEVVLLPINTVSEMNVNMVSVSENVPNEQAHEEEMEGKSQAEDELETDQLAKRKTGKNKGFLTVVSSRKRNYLTSPRKRPVPKTGGPTVGAGSHQREKPPIKH